MHNYYKLNNALEENNFSIYDDPIGLEKELKTIHNIYGIVLIEEPYLSSFALNSILYMYNNESAKSFNMKTFYPPIFVYVSDLYKIIYNENIIEKKELTFEEAIKGYIKILADNTNLNKIMTFNDYLMTEWNCPVEFGVEDSEKLTKSILNEVYKASGIDEPNDIK